MHDLLAEYQELTEGKTITLVPTYGRDYKSKKEVQAALDADQDFQIADMSSRYDGKPANKSDLMSGGYTTANIRYGKLRKVAVLKLKATPKAEDTGGPLSVGAVVRSKNRR